MSNDASFISPTASRQGQMPKGSPPVLQPGTKFIQRATGATELRVSYKLNTVDVPLYLPTPQQASPSFNNYWLDSSETDELVLGVTLMTLVYLGVNSIPPPRYFLRCNKITAPIDTNPNFPDLVKAAGGYTTASGTGPAKAVLDANGKFQGFGKDSVDPSLTGISVYDDTAVAYIAKFVSASRRLDLINKIETIWTPEGNPPSFSNRNWKMSDIDENEIGPGAFYEYEVTSELSQQGGWYKGIYGAAARAKSWT